MASSVPTDRQARYLRMLADGAMVLAPGRRDWSPLLRRGWVQAECEDDGKRFLPPLRITPAGLRALADAVERDGLPFLARRPRQLNEHPDVTELKAERTSLREQLRAVEHERDRLRWRIGRAVSELREADR